MPGLPDWQGGGQRARRAACRLPLHCSALRPAPCGTAHLLLTACRTPHPCHGTPAWQLPPTFQNSSYSCRMPSRSSGNLEVSSSMNRSYSRHTLTCPGQGCVARWRAGWQAGHASWPSLELGQRRPAAWHWEGWGSRLAPGPATLGWPGGGGSRSPHLPALRVSGPRRQVVVDLCGVRHRLQPLANRRQRARHQVGGALQGPGRAWMCNHGLRPGTGCVRDRMRWQLRLQTSAAMHRLPTAPHPPHPHRCIKRLIVLPAQRRYCCPIQPAAAPCPRTQTSLRSRRQR